MEDKDEAEAAKKYRHKTERNDGSAKNERPDFETEIEKGRVDIEGGELPDVGEVAANEIGREGLVKPDGTV